MLPRRTGRARWAGHGATLARYVPVQLFNCAFRPAGLAARAGGRRRRGADARRPVDSGARARRRRESAAARAVTRC